MELHTPLALDQGRRCQTLEAVQNTAEEVPRCKVYCGDTASVERDKYYNRKQNVQPNAEKKEPPPPDLNKARKSMARHILALLSL